MSDALNYLIKVRPEAMGNYFKFLKNAGDYLDPRTRDLISVITKVAVKTDSGFRQYLMRALHNGASPQEVIDALLMAFPVLGLAKIVWAMEILLDMDIPEFRPENLGAEPSWHGLGALDELPEGEISFLGRGSSPVRLPQGRWDQGLRFPLSPSGHGHPPPGPERWQAHLS